MKKWSIAVILPCYKVKHRILEVLNHIGPEVQHIYVIDDHCPQHTADFVQQHNQDPRVRLIRHDHNLGVGGAVMTGYTAAIAEGADIMVKVDGDGQMDPSLIPQMIAPIIAGEADYTKGNRFYDLQTLRDMPKVRLFGNAVLSLMAKLSTGYWDLFDPTNGYTAIHAGVATLLPFEKISRRYFFETDILFRLNTIRAVAVDVPMEARYGGEESNLKITHIIGEFLFKHIRNFAKRVFYNYYLRDMSIASLELPTGLLLLLFGVLLGIKAWLHSLKLNAVTPTGTIMIVALSILLGIQFIFGFLQFDISSVRKRPRHLTLRKIH